MGILDEAIRDHLDLKRRRGADPAEIERAEREALGPVHREPLGSEDLPAGVDAEGLSHEPSSLPPDDLPGHEPQSGSPEHADVYEDEFEDDEELEDDEEWEEYDDIEDDDPGTASSEMEPDSPRASAPPAPVASEAVPPPAQGDEPLSPRPPAPDQGAVREDEQTDDPDRGFGDTVAYDVPQHEPRHPEPGEAEEDVLEETPEFLQDTPDHDRLWFEQRPPRDFDFDE